jgi:hypothetical protein
MPFSAVGIGLSIHVEPSLYSIFNATHCGFTVGVAGGWIP